MRLKAPPACGIDRRGLPDRPATRRHSLLGRGVTPGPKAPFWDRVKRVETLSALGKTCTTLQMIDNLPALHIKRLHH